MHNEQLKSLEDMCVSPSAGNPLICFLAKDGYSILVDSRNRRSVGTLKVNSLHLVPMVHESENYY